MRNSDQLTLGKTHPTLLASYPSAFTWNELCMMIFLLFIAFYQFLCIFIFCIFCHISFLFFILSRFFHICFCHVVILIGLNLIFIMEYPIWFLLKEIILWIYNRKLFFNLEINYPECYKIWLEWIPWESLSHGIHSIYDGYLFNLTLKILLNHEPFEKSRV